MATALRRAAMETLPIAVGLVGPGAVGRALLEQLRVEVSPPQSTGPTMPSDSAALPPSPRRRRRPPCRWTPAQSHLAAACCLIMGSSWLPLAAPSVPRSSCRAGPPCALLVVNLANCRRRRTCGQSMESISRCRASSTASRCAGRPANACWCTAGRGRGLQRGAARGRLGSAQPGSSVLCMPGRGSPGSKLLRPLSIVALC